MKIYRIEIQADDRWHKVMMSGPIVHVATRTEDVVEVWYEHEPSAPTQARSFRVFGTGQSGVMGKHVGTAVTPSGRLVWHLREQT